MSFKEHQNDFRMAPVLLVGRKAHVLLVVDPRLT
jgi:hypothetical protein